MNLRRRSPLLSDDIAAALARVGDRLASGLTPAPEDWARVREGLGRLPPGAIAQASREICAAARLGWWREDQTLALEDRFRRQTPPPLFAEQMMVTDPAFAWLFIFHADGRIRQMALDRIADAPPTPFFFSAIAWRLNDWAEPVRAAAKRCATRIFPLSDPDVAAQASLTLLDREYHWSRWTDEKSVLHAVFGRPDVAKRLKTKFLTGSTGPLATRLRFFLRHPGYDDCLPRLARDAVEPAVRATALRALIERRVSWPVGFDWKWVDKTYGLRHRVTVLASRELSQSPPLDQLIIQGVQDSSPVVRRVAADALVDHRSVFPDPDALIAKLAQDRSASVRERADYMIRHPVRA